MNRLVKKEVLNTKNQQGSVVIFFLIMLPILLATMGLALDIGKFFIFKSELQNAADACALSAAYELDGTGTQFTRAQSAGLNLVQNNNVLFQRTQDDLVVTQVQFSTTANGGYANPAPANAGFVKCIVSTNANTVNYWFLQILGTLTPTLPVINAVAVATNVPGQTTCALPIGICEANLPASAAVGTWVTGILSPNQVGGKDSDSVLNGHFKWVDFTPGGGGANELADILSGSLPGSCNLSSTNPNIGTPGYKASLRDDYNTRFGIIKQNAKAPYITDFAGVGYYDTASQNRYSGDYLAKRASNTPYSDIAAIKIGSNFESLKSGDLLANGTNRRVALAPVVDCASFKVKRFACMFLLHPLPTQSTNNFNMYLEYLGNPSTQATPCGNSSGFAGAGNGIGPRVSALIQ